MPIPTNAPGSIAQLATQEMARRDLSGAMRHMKALAARAGLPTRDIVAVLTDLLREEQRLLEQEQINERSY